MAVYEENQERFSIGIKAFKEHLPVYVLESGKSGETCRDLVHTQYGLAAFLQSAEIAWKQGIDLYSEREERLLKGAEFHGVPRELGHFPVGTMRKVGP